MRIDEIARRRSRQRPLSKNIASSAACHEPSPGVLPKRKSRSGGGVCSVLAFLWSIFPPLMSLTLGGYRTKEAMSELRQRLLPKARQQLALMGLLRTFCA